MPEGQLCHISSAVLRVARGQEALVAAAAEGLGCEVALARDGKLVVVIEAASRGEVGSLLTALGLLDGVHSACMVYEQAEPMERLGEKA